MRQTARLAFLTLTFFIVSAMSLLAQHGTHEAHTTIGWVPKEILERPVSIRQGIGNAHEEVTTSSAQAQAFYDQGVAYLHSFVWVEAARSFHQALRLDPSLAMAHIGLSDVYVALQDFHAARRALEEAQSLGPKASERERLRIAIRARQLDYLDSTQDMNKYFAYRKAIDDALTANPGDPWLWILLGFVNEGTALGHGQAGGIESIALYQTAVALSPDNFAAHHYLAHTFENISRTKEALEQTVAYTRLAPSIPHSHHMHGHELRRAGHTADAILEFRKADELESNYYRAENISPEYDWHHAHNLFLLALCNQSLGKMKEAEQLFKKAFALPAYTDLAEFNRREWPEFLLSRGRGQEALEVSQHMLDKSVTAMGRFAAHSLIGRAMLAMNRLDEAKKELGLAEREMEQVPATALESLPNAGELRAEILLCDKKSAEGQALMKQIEERIRAMPGPDAWSEALFQLDSMARTARQTGDWELAEFIAHEIIRQDPSYAGGYYALALVCEHQSDAAGARREFASAEKRWIDADPELPEREYVRQHLTGRAVSSKGTEH